MGRYVTGVYQPINTTKFIGMGGKVTYRSSWELACMKFFDHNPAITKVVSECIAIPYFNPVKRRPANYYPDFYIEYTTKDGSQKKVLIEVKPASQVFEQKNDTTYAKLTRAVNYAKWQAAVKWCDAKGIEFQILTEAQIFGSQ